MNKLKNILLATTFGLSFGIGKGYSQEKEVKEGVFTYGTYEIEGKTYNVKYERYNNNGDGFIRYGNRDNKNNLLNYSEIYWIKKENPATQSYKNPNLSKVTQKEWEDAYDKNSNPQKKLTPGRNIDYRTPTNSNKNSDLEDLGKTIVTGAAIVGGIWLLNELFKPRQKNTYIEPPKNNPPVNKPLINESSKGPWWEEETKKSKNWWENKSENSKEENKTWWDDDSKNTEKKSKELSDLVKEQNKYSQETKKKLEAEAKIADEYFKEKGMNPGAQVKYKVLGTAEIGPNGELIKKDSYSPEREMTNEEKVILYYSYQAMKKDPLTGSVMEGVETGNELGKEGAWDKKYEESKKIFGQPDEGAPDNSFYYGTTKFQKDVKTGLYVAGEKLASPLVTGIEKSIDAEKSIREEGVKNWLNQQIKEEKEVDFLFAKPIGDNTYYYFKLAGKENLYKSYNESSKIANYIVIKNSPFGDTIINIAKDFKEKTEKSANFWDE